MDAIGVLHEKLVFRRRARVLADILVKQRRPDLNITGVDVLLRPASRIPVARV
jgi:hypothetical protein